MSMKKALVALAAMAISTGAIAGPSWTYVDLGVAIGNSDDDGEDTQAYALRGSFGFANIWHIQADIASGEEDGGKSNSIAGGFDVTRYVIRGGLHPAVSDNADFVLDIAYASTEAENDAGKIKGKSYNLRTGVRADVGKLELRSFVTWDFVDPDDGEKGRELGYKVGGQYNFSDAWSVGLDTDILGEENLSNLYVRWSF
jgi:hypothetical protein